MSAGAADASVRATTRNGRLLIDFGIVFGLLLGNLLILGPWLLTDFSNQPWNNDYIYTGMAKMFRDQRWTWNALEYAGAPFRYLYPPAFHALVAAVPVRSIGLAFHLVAGAGYALIPVALYVLGRQLFAGRVLPAFAALAYSLFPAPAYVFRPWRVLTDPWFHGPWGFVAMVGYDEAPHAFGMLFTILALAAAWRNRWLLASCLSAIVMLTNWPALIGLVLVLGALAVARTHDPGFMKSVSFTGALGGAAFGLSAFWITPGYFVSTSLMNRIVLRHTFVTGPLHTMSWVILGAAATLVAISLWRRIPARLALLLTWVALTGAVAIGTLAGNYFLPLAHRYLLEFNAGLVLLIAGLISLAPVRWQIAIVAAATVAGIGASLPFISHVWKVVPKAEDTRSQTGYQIAGWLNQHSASSRVFVAGEMESTLPIWSHVAKTGGGGNDVSNFLIFAANRQVEFGCGAGAGAITELWLRALNVRYVVVHRAASREYFHWFAQPDRFDSLPVVRDDGAGDRVHSVPGSGEEDAVVVDLNEMARLPQPGSTDDVSFLEAYVAWAAGKRPVTMRWDRPDSAIMDVSIGRGEAVLVKINNDAGWRASNATTRGDPIGFLVVEPRQGQQTIRLEFGRSWDAWLGVAISVFTVAALLWVREPRIWMAAIAVLSTLGAYAALMAREPPSVAVSEDAFVRLQPPMISPGGIVDGVTGQPAPFGRGRVIAVYGSNLGAARDTVRVRVGDQAAEVIYHGPNMVSFRMPVDAPAEAPVSVEVNGCQGNEFAVATR